MRALNLGCGQDVRHEDGVEWVNLDKFPLPGVDVVWDLEQHPWPLETASFERIEALDIWEHVNDWWGFMQECHRLLVPRGVLFIRTCAINENGFRDPDHKRWATRDTFGYWQPEHWLCVKYPHYASGAYFRELSARIVGDNWEFELEKLND